MGNIIEWVHSLSCIPFSLQSFVTLFWIMIICINNLGRKGSGILDTKSLSSNSFGVKDSEDTVYTKEAEFLYEKVWEFK